ncbi:MAG TPA: hypothetical protein PLR88_08240 [Bacteroidales bacterium]|nr:hypothetical protein [Bacteroidales bacterium]HPT21918.1 hypothetical protein [Bacteroidales bacterium]
MKSIFAQAEAYYLYEEYELANQLYLLLESSDNMNIKYKIGACYLNIPGEKEKSIQYLEEAVKTASYDSKTESFKEKKAPLDAYFLLAKAYMINNQMEKGLLTLQHFDKLVKETNSKGGMKNAEFVDQQIQACKNAIQFKENPVTFDKISLGDEFNLGSINENPAVSFDGNTLVYTERRGIVNVIYYSRKENGKWQPPVEITKEIKAGDDCSSCSLNNDGTELFLYKTDNYDGDIYSSDYVNGKWTPIKKLNKNINTKFYESHASISSDGKKLYFTSNREGGQGNLDIYVSEKDETGNWGPAINVGATINTPYNEDTPFITRNDSVLYFSSEGHLSIGGYDNFKSRRSGDLWNPPENLGFPINSTDDDKFFQPLNNGLNAYYSFTTNYKKKDIFYLCFNGSVNPDGYQATSAQTPAQQTEYDKVDLSDIPTVAAIDTSILITNVNVNDLNDKDVKDSDILFFTVQVIALHKPVDVSYFKYITDVKVIYNDNDKFYRYTTGIFKNKEEANALKLELLRKGYPDDIFVKKVSK